MTRTLTPPEPAALTISGAIDYSGLTRTYLYESRPRLDWIKAGRRSLITRESIDRLLAELLQQTQDRVRLRAAVSSKAAQTEPAP